MPNSFCSGKNNQDKNISIFWDQLLISTMAGFCIQLSWSPQPHAEGKCGGPKQNVTSDGPVDFCWEEF